MSRLRLWLLERLRRLTGALDRRWCPEPLPQPAVGGTRLMFRTVGFSLGRPILHVISLRGGFYMGSIEWSNQWDRPRFKADPDAVFDLVCVAEIYAALREMK